MDRSLNRQFFRKTTVLALVVALVVQVSSCGTLLHPERRGQTSGRIDPSIAILDGLGLLLFIIPGLIAYAIDFSSGAIYLPGTAGSVTPGADGEFVVVQTSPGGPTEAELEAILETHTGRDIDLAVEEAARIPSGQQIADPDEFQVRYAALIESGVIPQP